MADNIFGFVKDASDLFFHGQEYVTSMTDTTATLAKQKILQRLFASGMIQSEHIRLGLQIGIGYFLERQNQSNEYTLRERFPSSGTSKTPSHTLPEFDIEAYGPLIFHSLMSMYAIDASTLQQHICAGSFKEIVNPSSSGSLLYLTSDSTFLIKTLRDYDAKFIEQKFLKAYCAHLSDCSVTLIAKLFGAFGYIPHLSKQLALTVDSFTLRFAIFSNFIPTNIEIHEKYDLKGSLYKRDASIAEKRKTQATFKDNDFRALHPHGLTLPNSVYYYIADVLSKDIQFLASLNIMDYSLLLTVHNLDNQTKPNRVGTLELLLGNVHDALLAGMTENADEEAKKDHGERRKSILEFKENIEVTAFGFKTRTTHILENAKDFGGIPAINEKGERLLLYFGIIDILQTFDICKVMQRKYQAVENPDVVKDRSIVDTKFYAERFIRFILEEVFHPADDELPTHPIRMKISSIF